MNKKAQIDFELLSSVGFIILALLAVSATVIGWVMSKRMGNSFPVWQLLLIIGVEIVAAYFFAARG